MSITGDGAAAAVRGDLACEEQVARLAAVKIENAEETAAAMVVYKLVAHEAPINQEEGKQTGPSHARATETKGDSGKQRDPQEKPREMGRTGSDRTSAAAASAVAAKAAISPAAAMAVAVNNGLRRRSVAATITASELPMAGMAATIELLALATAPAGQ